MRRIGQTIAGWPRGRLLACLGAFALLGGVVMGVVVSGTSGPSRLNTGGQVGVGGGGDQSAPDSSLPDSATDPGQTLSSTPTTTAPGSSTTIAAAGAGRGAPAKAVVVSGSPSPSTTATTAPTKAAGPTWRQQAVPAHTAALQTIDCVDATHCWAGGYSGMMATTDGGATWTPQSFPALGGSDHVAGVSCSDTSTCSAVLSRGGVERTIDGGTTWVAQTVPALAQGGTAFGITCTDATHCWIVGSANSAGVVAATTDGGHTWTASQVCAPNTCSDVETLACPTTTECLVGGQSASSNQVADAVWASSDGGGSWSLKSTFPGGAGQPPSVTGLSCADADRCVYTTSAWIASTADGGSTWRTASAPSGAYTVACVASGACWAGGFNDSAVLYQPSWGSAWTMQYQAPSGVFSSISCLSGGQCWAAQGWGGDAQVQASRPGAIFARLG